MGKLFAMSVSFLGLLMGNIASGCCVVVFVDEPEMSQFMIEQ